MKWIFLFFINCCLITNCFSQSSFKVLVFSKTAAYRHQSIPAGIKAIEELGIGNGFGVDKTEDASKFTAENLSTYAAVVFLNTTGDVLNESQQQAFEEYIRNGGGYVGIHSASDTEYQWPWYGNLVGRYFDGHPAVQSATLRIVDSTHLATKDLPVTWERRDEWYNFKTPFPAHLNVLISVDESSYSGGTMGNSHPVAWYHVYDGGRSFYTAMGHTEGSYAEPLFQQHLLGGILWAVQSTVTANVKLKKEAVNIYPNPANELLLLDLQHIHTNKPLQLVIFDLKGSQRISTEIKEKNSRLDISMLTAGIYLLQLKGPQISFSQKLVVTK